MTRTEDAAGSASSEWEGTPPARWRAEDGHLYHPERGWMAYLAVEDARELTTTLNETEALRADLEWERTCVAALRAAGEALRERLRLAEAVCEAIRTHRATDNMILGARTSEAYEAWLTGAGAAPQEGE